MNKFKVGDLVRVVVGCDTSEYWHSHEIGDVVEIEWVYADGNYEAGGQAMMPHWLEPITTTLTPGQTYTSANGGKWECIYTRGNKAWLVSVYDGKIVGSAYAFDLDGTASWAGKCSRDDYNIVFEPVLEEWVDYADTDHGRVYIEYTVIDGKPDWENAKVTPA